MEINIVTAASLVTLTLTSLILAIMLYKMSIRKDEG